MGNNREGVEVGDLVLPSSLPAHLHLPGPRVGLQGVNWALLLPVSRPAAWGHQTDHGQPEATEEWP